MQRPPIPKERSGVRQSGNPTAPKAKFGKGNEAWFTPSKHDASGAVEIVGVKQSEDGKFWYRIKEKGSKNLYNDGQWVAQKKLSRSSGDL
ncbi:hypothetical protein PG990_015284 [Apiospora arundinis]